MITIKSEGFAQVSKVYGLMRNAGNPYYENVYLDFVEKRIVFQNESSVFTAPLTFDTDGSTVPANTFITGTKFFALTSLGDVGYDGNVFKDPAGNSYVIERFSDVRPEDFPIQPFDDWKETEINFTDDFKRRIALAGDYAEKQPTSSYAALFFTHGKMVALNKQRVFEADVSQTTMEDFVLPFAFVKILTAMDIQGKAKLRIRKVNGTDVIEIASTMGTYRMSGSSDYQLPIDIFSDDFNSLVLADCPNSVTLTASTWTNAINFLLGYLSDVKNAYSILEFKTLDSNGNPLASPYMKAVFDLDRQRIDYTIPVDSVAGAENLNGVKFSMFLSVLRQAVMTLVADGAKSVKLTYEKDSTAVRFEDADGGKGLFLLHTILDIDTPD